MIRIIALKSGDKIIITFVLIISVVLIGFIIANTSKGEEGNIVISVNGEIIERIPFYSGDVKQRFYQFTFGRDEHIGELEIKGDNVRMLPMSRDICPEAICSDIGWISGTFQSIVCMPNRIHVYIET